MITLNKSNNELARELTEDRFSSIIEETYEVTSISECPIRDTIFIDVKPKHNQSFHQEFTIFEILSYLNTKINKNASNKLSK